MDLEPTTVFEDKAGAGAGLAMDLESTTVFEAEADAGLAVAATGRQAFRQARPSMPALPLEEQAPS